MKFIIRWFSVAVGFLVASRFVPGVHVNTFATAIVLAAIWGILGLLVRPILVILTLPVTVLTFGLFIFVINAALFAWLGHIIGGFTVVSFFSAFLGSLVMSATGAIIYGLLGRISKKEE